jgi:hypothetical protein
LPLEKAVTTTRKCKMWLIDRQLDVEKYKYTSTVKLKEMAYHNK